MATFQQFGETFVNFAHVTYFIAKGPSVAFFLAGGSSHSLAGDDALAFVTAAKAFGVPQATVTAPADHPHEHVIQ